MDPRCVQAGGILFTGHQMSRRILVLCFLKSIFLRMVALHPCPDGRHEMERMNRKTLISSENRWIHVGVPASEVDRRDSEMPIVVCPRGAQVHCGFVPVSSRKSLVRPRKLLTSRMVHMATIFLGPSAPSFRGWHASTTRVRESLWFSSRSTDRSSLLEIANAAQCK